ncbi:MAG TPA: pirin family protein [Bacteroidales bacterium]|jgi:hypothetical protein|nr:pirin family protein [Bacteroidales bacterium]HRS18651.1 pirin family protein [Bacteroidales bacterium]
MKSILYKSDTIGKANHGWLQTHHYFSFADYYNAERIHFGMLRVLNDDIIAPNNGFGMHPHDNMEIITIPLLGTLWHSDSMGNEGAINHGEIQVMSAGSGVYHSEWNKDIQKPVHLFQIWIYPRSKNITPRYQQINISSVFEQNKLYQIVSPNQHEKGAWIHQNAWIYLGDFNTQSTQTYTLHSHKNGIFVLVIDGKAHIDTFFLYKRDALGIWDTKQIEIHIEAHTQLLLIEVPMN